jgi:hypothetical protein
MEMKEGEWFKEIYPEIKKVEDDELGSGQEQKAIERYSGVWR